MPQIREQIAMVHLPPSKTLKYLFHVRKTSKNPVTMRVSGFFFFCVRSENHPILGCSFHNFGKNSFLLYAPLFSAFCSHLLPKSPASGSGIPLTIACAEDSFEL